MISAPSEMRCKSMPAYHIDRNTTARTSGIESATTAPARNPRLRKLIPKTIATASQRVFMNSLIECSTVTGWLATSFRLDAIGEVRLDPGHSVRSMLNRAQAHRRHLAWQWRGRWPVARSRGTWAAGGARCRPSHVRRCR